MGKSAKIAGYSLFLFILLIVKVSGRFLHHELISDGTDDDLAHQDESSFLHLKGIDSSEEHCEQMYGFLPCSENILGHLFLIIVYEYLLYHGECYVSSGGKRIFKILGPGIFGASAFQVLGFLPESLILLVSGLFNTKDVAQEYVLTGVGLLAGSTIFLLTLLWGTCVIIGSKKISSDVSDSESDSSTQNPFKKFFSFLTGSGVTTDPETSSTAKIMLLSLIPFMFLLIPKLFGMTFTSHGYIFLITLPVSVTFLLVYFIYQVFEPSIQKRRLSYVKHEHLVLDILKHLQEHTSEKILTEDGLANLPAIKGLFTKIDQDGDSNISFLELKGLLQDIKFRQLTWNKEQTIEEVMKEFDFDGDEKVTMDEFVDRFTKWLEETKKAVNNPYRSVNSWKDLYQVVQPWVQTKKKERQMMKTLVSEIIRQAKDAPLGNFYKEDGITPNVSAIKRLFKSLDVDNNNSVSLSELTQLMMKVDFGETSWNVDEAASHITEDLDKSGDQQIDEEEFIDGFQDLLNKNDELTPKTPGPKDIPRQAWDKWGDDDDVDRSGWAWTQAVMLLVTGIVMLALLAEPLIHSVQNVSNSATIPSFFVSFVFVPLATNARATISAIQTASKRKEKTTSLTFSEIYDGVFMNNVLCFSVLVAVVYFRGLIWHFTAELLTVFFVCLIVGTTASYRSKFPVWTSITAYLLYPLSLIFVYVFADF